MGSRRHNFNSSLRVSDLIAELEDMLEVYGDLPVVSSCDYGDITHTEQLTRIASVETCVPVETGYSHSGYAFPEDDEDEEEGDLAKDSDKVVVLRYTY